uniref:Amino acid transporter transmembrane domain-containing protein n=1 Tax=Oryza brachyantha TaxID=4533 RepID=J3KUF6_ORYBR
MLCSLNYVLTAMLGYLIYGQDVQAQVTLNLPIGKLYTRIAILTTLITPLAKYALVIQPITTAIEEKLKPSAAAAEGAAGNNWLATRVLVGSHCRHYGGASIRGALLRLPHVVHRVIAERHRCCPVPVPELSKDLYAPGSNPSLRADGGHWYIGLRGLCGRCWHLHFTSPDYWYILICTARLI